MHALVPPGRLSIALMGTRGVPARYGGFETAVEEVGSRLAERGHRVTVYCRRSDTGTVPAPSYRGMQLVTLPAVRSRSLETLSHTGVSVIHEVVRRSDDAVFLFNAANAPYLPLLHLAGRSVAVHVDGLEWRRAKWSGAGRRYYRAVESLAVRWADALIADASGIARYYRDEFGAATELIAYGAPVLTDVGTDRLRELGLEPGGFHLVVARFEPENHVELIVEGYRSGDADLPLVVVGGAPYSDAYTSEVHGIARGDSRIRFVGPLWDQDQLDQLYAHCRLYLHGHSVGGTNPSLLRAMGAGAAVAAFDVVFNREVLGEHGAFFADPPEVAAAIRQAELDPCEARRTGAELRRRAGELYRWDEVTDRYEELAGSLASGAKRRRLASGRRSHAVAWNSGDLPRRAADGP